MDKPTAIVKVIGAVSPEKMERYGAILEEVDAIRVETTFVASQVVLDGKLAIGRALSEQAAADIGIGITELVQCVSKDVGINERDLWYCHKFAQEHDRLKELPEFSADKSISWNKVKKLLASPEKAGEACGHNEIEVLRVCVDCGCKVNNIAEVIQ